LLLRRAPGSAAAQLQAARCLAVCSQAASDADQKRQYVERALAAVALAVQGDFDDAQVLMTDPDLAPLNQESAFQSLLEKVRGK
jgi:hypothetical protein